MVRQLHVEGDWIMSKSLKHQMNDTTRRSGLLADERTRTPVPLPGPDDEVRPKVTVSEGIRTYFQGPAAPVTSSVLISNSKYLNNPFYREAYAMQALRRHGHDLAPTYIVPLMYRAIEEVTDFPRAMQLLAEEKIKNPEFAAWLDRRRLSTLKSDELAKCPAGTLGEAIYKFSQIPGINMEIIDSRYEDKPVTDMDYINKRRAISHDIEHIVSGFGPDTAGENALGMANVTSQACYFTPEFAQFMSHGLAWITSAGYNRTALHYHHVLPTYLDAMQQGINAGLALKQPLFMLEWEEYLDWNLDDLATHLGFKRGPAEAWAWTTEAARG
jgi:ubiquinone biosynthesis protein Coq4